MERGAGLEVGGWEGTEGTCRVEAGDMDVESRQTDWDSVGLQGKPEIRELGGKRLGGGRLCLLTGAAWLLGVRLYPSVLSQARLGSLWLLPEQREAEML